MPRVREFSEEDEDHFEIEDTQHEIDMEDSITVQKPNRNSSTNGSSSGDRLNQTQSKSDALKFKSITPVTALGSRSIYTWEHLDQNTPHVVAPVDKTDNIIESENYDDLDDDNLTNQELYNLLFKMYRKTTKKQERKIKGLETKINNLKEYIMSVPNQSNNNINRKKPYADAVIGHQTINTNVHGQRTQQRHIIKPNTDIMPITKSQRHFIVPRNSKETNFTPAPVTIRNTIN
jgi:hypothetical protein